MSVERKAEAGSPGASSDHRALFQFLSVCLSPGSHSSAIWLLLVESRFQQVILAEKALN